MADTNAQMEELARILEQVNAEMAAYGRITKQTADDKFDAEMKNKIGINNATKGLTALGEGLSSVAGAAGAAGKAMYEGKKGAAAFNESIDGLSKAAQAAGIALSLMIPGGPVIKLFIAGLTAAVTATAEYVKAANEMADKLYKGYSGLSKAGAAASDGMTGVYRDAKKLGLSMNELDGFVGLVAQNSKDLALFAGSVYEGRQKFAEMGDAMEPYRKSLIAAGMSQEMINEGSMSYLKLQTRIGTAQRMTTDQLAEGARRYLIEQDALAKLTGTSRKEMEDQMEAARSEQRFRAKLEEVRVTQGEDAAKRLEQANVMISSQSKEMGQAFRDISTGFIGTEAAQKGMMGTQGELMRSTQQLVSGQKDQFQAVTSIGRAAGQFAKDMNMTAQLGTFNDMATDYAGQLQLGIFAEQDKAEMMKKITADQKKQGLEGGAAADKVTEQYAKNIKQQQELNKRMEDAVFKGIDNALSLTNKLGNATSSLTTAFETLTTAVNKVLNVFGLGTKEDKSAVKQQEIGTAEAKYKEAQAAQKTAKTTEEKAAADREAKFYQEKVDLLKQEKAVIVKQETNAKLDAEVLKRAEDEVKIKIAAHDKAFATASIAQKMGIGEDADQKRAREEMWSAVQKERDLRSNKGGMRDTAKAELAKQKASPAAPTAPAAPTTAPLSDQSNAEAKRLNIPPGKGVPADATAGTVNLEDYIKFTSNTGDRAHFDQLNPVIRESFVEMAKQYFDATGNKLQVNSAFRSAEEQGKVNSGPNPKAAPGMSLHQHGRAVDINSDQRVTLEKMGLLSQHGFSPLQNDPPHIFMAKGGIVGARAGGTEIIAGEAGQDEAVIPLEGGAVPVNLNMKPPAAADTNYLEKVFESGFAELSTAFAKLSDIDVLSNTIAQIKNRQFGLPDASEVAQSEDANSTVALNEMSGKYERMLAEALEKQAAQQAEQSSRMIDALAEMIRTQKDSNSIQERILQTSM